MMEPLLEAELNRAAAPSAAAPETGPPQAPSQGVQQLTLGREGLWFGAWPAQPVAVHHMQTTSTCPKLCTSAPVCTHTRYPRNAHAHATRVCSHVPTVTCV